MKFRIQIRFIFFFFFSLFVQSCIRSSQPFVAAEQPPAADYSDPSSWAALPFRKDAADLIPAEETWISDSLKRVDVFYVYPTVYLSGRTWNADTKNNHLNRHIDKFPVKFQASPFNRVARVYAPRYRQAIINSFIDTTGNGKQALTFAYEDIKRAFQYYLEHYNNGRPVIIASHSQGTFICRKLIKEFFDTPETKKKLVCAYIIGYAVDSASYQVIAPCRKAEDINCFVTWSTFKHTLADTKLKSHTINNMSVNPITWRMDTAAATTEGGILFHPGKKNYRTTAKVKGNNLFVKTNTPCFKYLRNMHVMDYNYFWYDIRKNAEIRVEEYFRKN